MKRHMTCHEVRPEGRSTILAWESALESTFACILGNAMAEALDTDRLSCLSCLSCLGRAAFGLRLSRRKVGFLAENVFGYRRMCVARVRVHTCQVRQLSRCDVSICMILHVL